MSSIRLSTAEFVRDPDRVHARDEAEIAAGRIKPTHMFAVMQTGGGNDSPHQVTSTARAAIRWRLGLNYNCSDGNRHARRDQ